MLDQVGEDTIVRVNLARAILPVTHDLASLLASDQAMEILCMKRVNVRLGGNHVTQPTADNVVNSLAVLRTAAEGLPIGEERKGVLDILQYDFSIHSQA
jgi:hypothetical protein